MTTMRTTWIAALLIALGTALLPAQTVGEPQFRVPIRSITRLHGSMTNTLTGIGLVTGLDRTGSNDRATRQAIANLAQKFGVNLSQSQLNSGAVAMVTVTAELPSFAHEGMPIDVQVHALTEVTSLESGYLLPVELVYFDGDASTVYAVASGTISTGGFGYGASTTRVSRNNPASGRVNRGAKVVRSVAPELLSETGEIELMLRTPSLATATNISRMIESSLGTAGIAARVHDEALVRVLLPETQRSRDDALRALALVSALQVEVEHPSRVVIDIDSGTIVVGNEVRISPCVVMASDITVTIVDQQDVVQPLPWSRQGTTERVDRSLTEVDLGEAPAAGFPGNPDGATVADLAENLRSLGLTTRQIVTVFQQLDRGGFLHAPLEIR